MQASFGALLSGDRTLLERHYTVATKGTQQQWQMTLTPKDRAMAARVRDILARRGADVCLLGTSEGVKTLTFA